MTGEKVLRLLQRLDELAIDYGGRVYLAKDARLSPESLRAMYPRLEEWQRIKQAVDPEGHFQSDLSRRLQLAGAL
jgi:FAD/FMN-containing dehydrogenase